MIFYDSVIFDFDGTVADTGAGVFSSVRYAIDKEGLPQPSDSVIRTFAGPPLFDSFHDTFPEIDDNCADRLIDYFRENYSAKGVYQFELYDGMENLLKELKESGIKTAIASSKPTHFIKQIIAYCGLDKYFDIPIGAQSDKVDPNKTDIVRAAKERLSELGCSKPLMVGDRKFDILGAHSQNIPIAAVLFGFGSREEFEEYKAEYIVADCDELRKIIMD